MSMMMMMMMIRASGDIVWRYQPKMWPYTLTKSGIRNTEYGKYGKPLRYCIRILRWNMCFQRRQLTLTRDITIARMQCRQRHFAFFGNMIVELPRGWTWIYQSKFILLPIIYVWGVLLWYRWKQYQKKTLIHSHNVVNKVIKLTSSTFSVS